MDWLTLIHGATNRPAPLAFRTGDEVRVWFKILEQGKERLGQFEGLVIRVRGSGASKTFTVRRVTHGEGVERIFPADAKTIARIEVLRRGRVKRSRLYFLRRTVGKTRIASAEGPGGSTSTASTGSAGGSNKAAAPERSPDARASAERTEGAVAAADRPAE